MERDGVLGWWKSVEDHRGELRTILFASLVSVMST
jgi:hypothetical protein